MSAIKFDGIAYPAIDMSVTPCTMGRMTRASQGPNTRDDGVRFGVFM